jgi:hypothetical protein
VRSFTASCLGRAIPPCSPAAPPSSLAGLAGPGRCWMAIRSRADSGQIRPLPARHMIGRLLDPSRISWRTCRGSAGGSHEHHAQQHHALCCRIEPYLDQGGAATRRRGPALGLCLGRPGRRRPHAPARRRSVRLTGTQASAARSRRSRSRVSSSRPPRQERSLRSRPPDRLRRLRTRRPLARFVAPARATDRTSNWLWSVGKVAERRNGRDLDLSRSAGGGACRQVDVIVKPG